MIIDRDFSRGYNFISRHGFDRKIRGDFLKRTATPSGNNCERVKTSSHITCFGSTGRRDSCNRRWETQPIYIRAYRYRVIAIIASEGKKKTTRYSATVTCNDTVYDRAALRLQREFESRGTGFETPTQMLITCTERYDSQITVLLSAPYSLRPVTLWEDR